MSSHPNYVKKQLAIDIVSWTPIVAPIDCMGVAIKNSTAADMRTRTDFADPPTQDTIAAGNQDGITVPHHGDNPHGAGRGIRFLAGETIAFLQGVSGTSPALITYVR